MDRPRLLRHNDWDVAAGWGITRVVARELLASARRSVLIVGFAFHDAAGIFAPLADRMASRPELDVRIMVNLHSIKGLSPAQTLERFSQHFWREIWPFHPRPAVHYYRPPSSELDALPARLHAKLIAVDDERVLIGSANFTGAAFRRNLELGVVVTSEEAARRIRHYFEAIIAMAGAHLLDST